MGIYNCEDTLGEALESLLAQTYQNFKVIMCDDGSVDSTYKIACEYSKKYPEKFILLKNSENIKLAATLNRCLKYVDTEYVARMDGDDISLPHRFQKQIDFLDLYQEYAFVSSPMIYFDENNIRIGKVIEEPSKYDFIRGTPFCHAPVMIRAFALKAVDGYDSSIKRSEDYDLWSRLYTSNYKGFNITEPLYKMRDDFNAYKRRTYCSRIEEFIIRKRVYSRLNIPWYYWIYSIRPLLVGLLPFFIYKRFRRI